MSEVDGGGIGERSEEGIKLLIFFSLNNLLLMLDITSLKGTGKLCIVYFNIAESKSKVLIRKKNLCAVTDVS